MVTVRDQRSHIIDTIDHNILITRLQRSFGFGGNVLNWFSSYLNDRTQTVCIDNDMSQPAALLFGVPQGSVLGPILFSLYTQPLSEVITQRNCSFHKYADDTEISKSTDLNSFLTNQFIMQDCISDILTWMQSNKLKLNPEKTEFMVAGTKYSLDRVPSDSISVGNNSISIQSSVRYLGVTIDSSLSMQRHISDVCRSCFLALRRISSIRPFISKQSTSTLIHASITSRLDYCNSTLTGVSSDQLSRLQRVQNCAVRLVLKKGKREHVTPMLKQVHWLPISFRIQYKLSVLAFRHFENTLPVYLSKTLQTYQPSRTLRSSSEKLLTVPFSKSKFVNDRSFSFSVPRMWNSLPSSLRDTPSLSQFKSQLKTYLFRLAFD